MTPTYYRARVRRYPLDKLPYSWGSPMANWMDKYVTAYQDSGGGWHILEDSGWVWTSDNFILLNIVKGDRNNNPNFLFSKKKANDSEGRERKA